MLLAASALLAKASETAPSLFRVRSVIDAAGTVHQLGGKPGVQVTVLVFLSPECPISQRYIPELNRIAAAHTTNTVEFYGVVAGQTMTRSNAVTFVREYAITFPVLVDERLSLARWLRPTHVPEAYVLKPDGDVVYHGRIDDGYEAVGRQRTVVQHRELRDAIEAVLAGKTPAPAFARPVGCYFEELPPR